MQKPERLLKILTLLQSKRRAVTALSLAQHFQVSERTIYRDIQALTLSGIAIEGEAGVGYLLRKGEVLPPLTFTESELESLILGVRMVQGWGDKALGESADMALTKIRAILPDRLHYLHSMTSETLLVPDFERDKRSQFSRPLREAIKNKLRVEMEYEKENGEKSTRTIWPLGLVYWGKVWTLISWCELRNDYRTFRLDRITNIHLKDNHFETTEQRNLNHYLKRYEDCDIK